MGGLSKEAALRALREITVSDRIDTMLTKGRVQPDSRIYLDVMHRMAGGEASDWTFAYAGAGKAGDKVPVTVMRDGTIEDGWRR